MEKVFIPTLTVSFAVDIEIEHNPFEGLTAQDLAIRLQDEITFLILEASPRIENVFTSITAIEGPAND